MIAKCRAKACIVQLKEKDPDATNPYAQRALKGNIIIYPQKPDNVANILPPPIDEIISHMCVIFVGNTKPTKEWLKEKAKPLVVRREKVRAALSWLKIHNPLYKDITINHEVLNTLEDNGILPFEIEHQLPQGSGDETTASYDPNSDSEFESVVVTDVNGNASSHDMRAAAVRHIKNGGSYLSMPHGQMPANEFFNIHLFPMIYPTLFPYGIGGFEDKRRKGKSSLSMKRHVKHLLSLEEQLCNMQD
ncbi:hypothetical protein BOTBODRAFT_55879 [Botryobasidium botryosum FD-172 SS1]|uniref:DUF6570 domain-containing protein n=1 Tax=Botryobasidium botryosum (strain FD-172 SS1) TaxID=930990 RepID=A0A067MQP6_BOTB1|nr:hypothetical protein BOTBODRAFT_55879 [Botryobasidium botryosum FD-172 SS1]